MKITLAEAFMLRNDLKKEIEVLKSLLVVGRTQLWQDKSCPKTFIENVTFHPEESYNKVCALMDKLCKLNIAIANANSANNEILQKLQTLSAKIALQETIVRLAMEFPGTHVKEQIYNRDGTVTDIEKDYQLLIDPSDIKMQLEASKRAKRAFEKDLHKNNYRIEIDID